MTRLLPHYVQNAIRQEDTVYYPSMTTETEYRRSGVQSTGRRLEYVATTGDFPLTSLTPEATQTRFCEVIRHYARMCLDCYGMGHCPQDRKRPTFGNHC